MLTSCASVTGRGWRWGMRSSAGARCSTRRSIWSLPDVLVSALVYAICGVMLRARRRTQLRWAAMLGALLGLAYLAKTPMLALAPVFLAASALVLSDASRRTAHLAVASLAMSSVAVPFILVLSIANGRLTAGDSAALNYLWHIDDAPLVHWQGGPPPMGQPLHHSQLVLDRPPVYAFDAPFPVTYAPWYAPEYWFVGATPFVRLGAQVQAIWAGLQVYSRMVVDLSVVLAVLGVVLSMHRRPWSRRWSGPWLALMAPAVAALCMYSLVLVEARYVAPFVVLFVLALLMLVRLPKSGWSATLLTNAVLLIVLVQVLQIGSIVADPAGSLVSQIRQGALFQPDDNAQVALALRSAGVESQAAVATGDRGFNAYWARLARVRIVAEVSGFDGPGILEADPQARDATQQALLAQDVRAVVARGVACLRPATRAGSASATPTTCTTWSRNEKRAGDEPMAEDLIIRNVTLIDGSGGPPMPSTEVAIKDGRFAAIRPSGSGAAEATLFDGCGGYLLPGLWEGHTHLRARPDEAQADPLVRLETILADYLAAGITTVLELGGPVDIDGRLRERRRSTASTDAAELFFAGPAFTGLNGWPLHLHHDHALVREAGDAESARRMVLELAGAIDFIKCIYDGQPGAPDKLPRPALQAIVAAAHERGMSVLVHILTKRDLEEAVDAGADCIEHGFLPSDADDLTEAEDVAGVLARAGTYFSPTLTVFEQIGRSGDRAYLDDLVADEIISTGEASAIASRTTFGAPFPHHPADETLARFQYAMRSLPIMHAAGVKIAAGSDVALFMSRPAALLRELQLLARSGLPNGEVIVAGTRHVAEKIRKGNSVGIIAVGQIADALLLDADPLADITHLTQPSHHMATLRRGHLSAAAVLSTPPRCHARVARLN